MRLYSRFTLGIAMTAVMLLLAGCGGGGGGGGDNTPPTINSRTVDVPESFSFEGGTVVISAQVTDAGGVAQVSARVTGPGSSDPTTAAMTLTSGSTYSGQYTAPANLREDGQAETYSVVIVARDTSGNTAESQPVTFQVPAPDMPDPPF